MTTQSYLYNMADDLKTKGGFFDLPASKRCMDRAHDFPNMLYIPPGKGYTHVCPSCGAKSTAVNNTPSMELICGGGK